MKIEILSQKVICSNEHSIHSYFAWPTVTRLRDGRLAMVASGFRLAHICPFGKCIISYSDDEGATWSLPAVIIDTALDDRDGGITAFGEKSVIVTSLNNGMTRSRRQLLSKYGKEYITYKSSYLDLVEQKFQEEQYLTGTYRISHDNGRTFGEITRMPVTCPHGPAEMADGSLLCVGRKCEHFAYGMSYKEIPVNENHLICYQLTAGGEFEFLSEIENVGPGILCTEPHAIVLESGKIIVHFRCQDDAGMLTVYQCESYDGGRSFTKAHRLLSEKGGAPAHIINQNGTLISVYGYRQEPYGIRAMFSNDEGNSWDVDHVIADNGNSADIGYPASVPLQDGSILTVYYDKPEGYSSNVIMQVIWKYSNK